MLIIDSWFRLGGTLEISALCSQVHNVHQILWVLVGNFNNWKHTHYLHLLVPHFSTSLCTVFPVVLKMLWHLFCFVTFNFDCRRGKQKAKPVRCLLPHFHQKSLLW